MHTTQSSSNQAKRSLTLCLQSLETKGIISVYFTSRVKKDLKPPAILPLKCNILKKKKEKKKKLVLSTQSSKDYMLLKQRKKKKFIYYMEKNEDMDNLQLEPDPMINLPTYKATLVTIFHTASRMATVFHPANAIVGNGVNVSFSNVSR